MKKHTTKKRATKKAAPKRTKTVAHVAEPIPDVKQSGQVDEVSNSSIPDVKPMTAMAKLAAINALLRDDNNDLRENISGADFVDEVTRIMDTPMPSDVPRRAGDQHWRSSIDWVAAGKKAHETRMRNAALRASGQPVPVRTASPGTPKPKAGRGDADRDAYVARLTAAIARTTVPYDAARIANIVGKDFGAGWLIVATDGQRALTRKAAPGEQADKLPTPILETDAPAQGLTITPALEQGLRDILHGLKKPQVKDGVTFTVDGRAKTVTITSKHQPAPIVVPAEGDLRKAAFRVNARLLLDAFGRGGRLGWSYKPRTPLVLETPDALRYVLMPIAK
jgi:hypothetical protein